MGILVPPPPSRLRDISRHTFGSDLFDTLAPIWDIRWIVVAQGVEFSNALWESHAVNFETNPNLTVGRGRHRRPITDKERRQAAKVRRGMKIPHSLRPEFPDMLMWDDWFAYWTTKPSPGPVTRFWIRSLFKYRKYNAHSNWEPSLQYAVKETNRLLRNEGFDYRVI